MDDIAQISASAVTPLLRNHAPPPAFVNYVGQWFHANVPQTGIDHWQNVWGAGLGAGRARGPAYGRRHNVAAGAVVNAANALTDTRRMLRRLLTGAGGLDLRIGAGTALPNPDPAPAALPAAAVGGQAAVPLEYRWISVRPNAAGQLWGAMQTVLAEVRDANLAQVPAGPAQQAIRNTW